MSEEQEKQLKDLKFFMQTEGFQEWIVKPLRKYQDAQKNNFFSDSLKDSWRKGGRVEGVEEFFKTLKVIDEFFNNLS